MSRLTLAGAAESLHRVVALAATMIHRHATKMKTSPIATLLGILSFAITASADFATEMLDATFKFFDPKVTGRAPRRTARRSWGEMLLARAGAAR